ncbi:MAG: transcription antitermination factor NusB [Candidatus Aureabacteria bacterium]|nr:transcription antitermination factor NusB [Candidatus Auribacterota bacterium]
MEGKRRKAREIVLRLLYSIEINPKAPQEALEDYCLVQGVDSVDPFTADHFKGIIKEKDKIDGYIKAYAQNWKIERIALIDKNIMRIAIYEMLTMPDIPRVVSINEAVDIAKKYSTKDSGKFVNGILDKINKDLH